MQAAFEVEMQRAAGEKAKEKAAAGLKPTGKEMFLRHMAGTAEPEVDEEGAWGTLGAGGGAGAYGLLVWLLLWVAGGVEVDEQLFGGEDEDDEDFELDDDEEEEDDDDDDDEDSSDEEDEAPKGGGGRKGKGGKR
jgi:hypothetical protein